MFTKCLAEMSMLVFMFSLKSTIYVSPSAAVLSRIDAQKKASSGRYRKGLLSPFFNEPVLLGVENFLNSLKRIF